MSFEVIFQKVGKKYSKKLEILAQVEYHKYWLLALRHVEC